MNKKLDELLYDALKPENEPAPELNRRILNRRVSMKKWNFKKTAAAAACCCIVLAGSVSAYAAAQHFSLLSMFTGESTEVRENAAKLLDTAVEQKQQENQEQSQYVNFKIKEAICDKNKVIVQIEARALEPEKYMLVPLYEEPEIDPVSDLNIKGVTGKQTIAEYAKSIGKKCLGVQASVFCEAGDQSISDRTDAEGTLFFTIEFDNEEKTKKLNYVCGTYVAPPEGTSEDTIKNEISFTLTDKSKSKIIRYLPVSKKKVEGTNLIVDKVIFEKSDLEIVCKVKYHYAGSLKDWSRTTDADIAFFILDEKGQIIESNGGSGSTFPDGTKEMTQSWSYPLMDLPDTITLQAKDVCEKNLFGTVDVKLAN